MERRLNWRSVLRFALALIALFGCYRLVIGSATYGVSRIFTTMAFVQAGLSSADTAVRLSPADPEARYARALTLVNLDRLNEAVAELQLANRLRPHHYYQWLDLGVTTQRLGNQAEAAAALRESVRLAPSFAQPHWQLGNLFFREGRFPEAFEELRLGTQSDPDLIGGMLDLGWVAANGDVPRFEALIQPQSGRMHFAVARFLAKQGKGADSVRQARAAGQAVTEDERRFLKDTIAEILARGNFSEAFDVWTMSHPSSGAEKGQIVNGNFTDPVLANDPGFGWQPSNTPNIVVSIDPTGPVATAGSLRVDFSGENAPGSPAIQQLVLISPNSRYTLSFMARTEKLISGGPPVIVVLDPRSDSVKILGQSRPVSSGSSDWTAYTAEFSTDEKTEAILISVQRLPCNQSPCPVFGGLWLSRFTLTKA
jgi:Carbohydrate binding domain/Tetratricopeptide repeat